MPSASDPYVRIANLEEQLEHAQQRIAFLTADAEQVEAMIFRFTPREEVLFKCLMRRMNATKEILFDALYFAWPEGEQPEIKIVDVFMCKVRNKLKPHGITVLTRWGHGYYMLEKDKQKAREVMKSYKPNGENHV